MRAAFVLAVGLAQACSSPRDPCVYDIEASAGNRVTALMEDCGHGQPTGVLVEALTHDPDPVVRGLASLSLVERADPSAVDGFDRLVADAIAARDAAYCQTGFHGLARINDAKAIERLVTWWLRLNDPSDIGPRSASDTLRQQPLGALSGALSDTNLTELRRVIDAHIAERPEHRTVLEAMYERARVRVKPGS